MLLLVLSYRWETRSTTSAIIMRDNFTILGCLILVLGSKSIWWGGGGVCVPSYLLTTKLHLQSVSHIGLTHTLANMPVIEQKRYKCCCYLVSQNMCRYLRAAIIRDVPWMYRRYCFVRLNVFYVYFRQRERVSRVVQVWIAATQTDIHGLHTRTYLCILCSQSLTKIVKSMTFFDCDDILEITKSVI